MSDFFDDSQGNSNITYKPSVHAFTDPIRYFKANDPYYWEVDNIPLNQIQSNVLWLKDQISAGGITEVGDVSRQNFLELRPGATGDDRTVSVQPGRFMGRVNDAYGTGLFKIAVDAYTSYAGKTFEKQESITIPDTVLLNLIGSTVNNIVANNGLYDHLQTHVSNNRLTTTIVDWGNYYTSDVRNDLGVSSIYDIPKIKLSLWGQDTTTHSYYGPLPTDLQQRAVAWTRAWGAPFRTALVNVEDTMYINVPDFSDDDYSNESNYVPSVRVDLLFVYTKPIDASSTTIAKPVGTSPASITSPQLGLVRGAGVVALAGGGGWGADTIDSTFLGSTDYTGNYTDQNQDYWLKEANAFDANGNPQISSPVGDLNQTSIGTSGVYGNFPSPDDLMNLAPYITTDLVGTKSVALVGQSVLPLAYIFVRKGQTTISEADILDIRPFFRTTELTYNERSGIAAANPPISIANPVVSDSDVTNRIKRLYDQVIAEIPPPPEIEIPTGLIATRTWELMSPDYTKASTSNGWTIPLLDGNQKTANGKNQATGNVEPGYDPSGLIAPGGSAPYRIGEHQKDHIGNGYAYITLKRGYVWSIDCAPWGLADAYTELDISYGLWAITDSYPSGKNFTEWSQTTRFGAGTGQSPRDNIEYAPRRITLNLLNEPSDVNLYVKNTDTTPCGAWGGCGWDVTQEVHGLITVTKL